MVKRRDEYIQKLKEQLDHWNAEIDELEARAHKAKAQVGNEYDKKIRQLREKRDEAKETLARLPGAGEEAWESLKAGADRAWQNLKRTLEETKEGFREGLEKGSR